MRGGRWRLPVAVAAICATAFAVSGGAEGEAVANAHFSAAGTIALPGRGMSLAWSPAGDALATGGHFKDKLTGQRYDTRTVDVRGMRMNKSFDCHYWWTIAHAWQRNPYIGDVIADGGGDHAVKIWRASGSGSTTCSGPGQFRVEDGGVKALYDINGWVTSLAFSPDGRYLAAASRDRTVRIWQISPGIDQWKVVRLWYDKAAKQYLSVRWSPDGRRLVTGDRAGRVAEWSFDPIADRWDATTIAAFAKMGFHGHPYWFSQNAALLAPKVLWSEGGHKEIWNARYSPDGNRVAAAGTDGVLSVYEARTGRVLYRTSAPTTQTPAPKPHARRQRTPRATALHGLDWSPDGALIAAGAADKVIYVFSAADGSLYDRLVGHKELVTAVAWSPDGRTLASTAGGERVAMQNNQLVQGPDDAVHLWARK